MPRPDVDANDPRNRALRSNPPGRPPLLHGLDESPPEEVPTGEGAKWRDINWSSDLLHGYPFRSSLPNSPRCQDDEQADQAETASDSLGGDGLAKFRRNLMGSSPVLDDRGLFGTLPDSPSADDSQYEIPNREKYWSKRFARRIKDSKDSKDQDVKLQGLGIHGIDFKVSSHPNFHSSVRLDNEDFVADIRLKDASATSEPLHPIMSPQEETKESLNNLINELIAEDGQNAEMEALTLIPDKDNAYDPALIETAVNRGLTDDEVTERRKNHGWNRMTQDKPNHLLKFLMFFMGPIQWVMEVSRILIALAWPKDDTR